MNTCVYVYMCVGVYEYMCVGVYECICVYTHIHYIHIYSNVQIGDISSASKHMNVHIVHILYAVCMYRCICTVIHTDSYTFTCIYCMQMYV